MFDNLVIATLAAPMKATITTDAEHEHVSTDTFYTQSNQTHFERPET